VQWINIRTGYMNKACAAS